MKRSRELLTKLEGITFVLVPLLALIQGIYKGYQRGSIISMLLLGFFHLVIAEVVWILGVFLAEFIFMLLEQRK